MKINSKINERGKDITKEVQNLAGLENIQSGETFRARKKRMQMHMAPIYKAYEVGKSDVAASEDSE